MIRAIPLLLAASVAAAGEGISWAEDLETAMTLSSKDGRPVIGYFTFDT